MNAERHQWASGAITVKNTFFELVLPEAELLQRSKSAPAPTTDTSVGSDEASEESDEESQQSQCKDGEGQTQGSQSQESVQCEALSTPPESDVDQLQAMGYSIEEANQRPPWTLSVKNTFFHCALVSTDAEFLQRSKSLPTPTTDISVGSDEAGEEIDEESQQGDCKDGQGQTQGSQSQESVQCKALSTPPESHVDQRLAMGYSIEVVDTVPRCESVCKELLQTGAHTEIAVDSEGVALSRVGELCTLQVATRDGRVFIFDVVRLGSEGFECGLRQVLGSESIAKLLWDCRCDADALHHQFSVDMRNVLDMQVLHSTFKDTGNWLHRLEKVLGDLLSAEECNRVEDIKTRGKQMYEPSLNGSNEIWKQRPLKDILKKYCAIDVGHLFKMFDTWKDCLDRDTLRQVSERRAEDRVHQPAGAPNKGAQKDFKIPVMAEIPSGSAGNGGGGAPPGEFFPGEMHGGGVPMAGRMGGGFGGMIGMPHMAMYPPFFEGPAAAQWTAGFQAAQAAKLRAAQLSEAAELHLQAAQLMNQAALQADMAAQQAMSSVSTTSDEAKSSVSTTSPMMGPTEKDAFTKGNKMTPSQNDQGANGVDLRDSSAPQLIGASSSDPPPCAKAGLRCSGDSNGAQHIFCTIPESMLQSKSKSDVSRFKLEVNGEKLDFMLILTAANNSCKGPGGFKHSGGNGTLQLKCCSDCSQLPAMSLGFRFFVGDQPKRGPIYHDFKLSAITAETAVWHLRGSVEERHFVVSIEVEPPWQ